MKIIWSGFCNAVIIDKDTGVLSMDPRIIADEVIGKLWVQVQFPKLCGTLQNASFERIYEFLTTNSSIGTRRRDLLITPRDLCCLSKGCNWTTLYWYDCVNCPCSLYSEQDYGFKCIKTGGKTEFDDQKDLPPRKQTNATSQGKKIWWPV